MSSPRTLIITGTGLLVFVAILAGVLFGLGPPPWLAPWLATVAATGLVIGVALLLAGVIRSASTTTLIVAGAALQAIGGLLLFAGPARPTREFVFLGMTVSAFGFWLLLTGVIGAGVGLAMRERNGEPARGDVDVDR
jgi:hypothetical protein